MLLWMAAACGGPRLQGDTWALGAPLLGPGLVNQPPRCNLVFNFNGPGAITWVDRCERGDLPTDIVEVDLVGPGHLYAVNGGTGTDAQWFTRQGEHPGLFELWVFAPDYALEGGREFDADQVIWMWRLDD